jgi:hypothetical protein
LRDEPDGLFCLRSVDVGHHDGGAGLSETQCARPAHAASSATYNGDAPFERPQVRQSVVAEVWNHHVAHYPIVIIR